MVNLSIRRIKPDDAIAVSKMICRNFMEVNIKDYPRDEIEQLSQIYNPNKIIEISGYAHMYVACTENHCWLWGNFKLLG